MQNVLVYFFPHPLFFRFVVLLCVNYSVNYSDRKYFYRAGRKELNIWKFIQNSTLYYLVSYFFGLLTDLEKDKVNLATRKENVAFADLVCDMPGTGDSSKTEESDLH